MKQKLSIAIIAILLNLTAQAAFNIDFDLKNDKMREGCHSIDAEFIITTSETCPSENTCTYFWYFGDGDSLVTNSTSSITHQYVKDGTFTVSLAVRDTAADKLIDTLSSVGMVTLYNPSEAEISAVNLDDDPNLPILSFLYRFSPDFESNHKGVWDYSWDFGDGATSAEDTVEHIYANENITDGYKVLLKTSLDVGQLSKSNADIDKYGLNECFDTTSLQLKVKDEYFENPEADMKDRKPYQPNIFTPNGDGENDIFFLNTNGSDHFDFYVYNRWGSLIFQLENVVEVIWEGKNMSDEDVPSGTYFYIATSNRGDNRHELKGTITLFR